VKSRKITQQTASQITPPNSPMLVPESKNYLEPSQITLAETLKGAGYRTAHIGKWHLGNGAEAPTPEAYGFEFVRHTTGNARPARRRIEAACSRRPCPQPSGLCFQLARNNAHSFASSHPGLH
jgi:arylsulfatase A-like enzyme